MDYYFNTTSGTGTSAARAAAYVRQEVPRVLLPDSATASANVSWGAVAVGIAFSFQTSELEPEIYPGGTSAIAVSSSGLFFGADLQPVVASATVVQSDTPTLPETGGESGLKFYWG